MPTTLVFDYPAPVFKPRPVKAVIGGPLQLDLPRHAVSGELVEYLQPVDESGNPVPDAALVQSTQRQPFTVYLSDTQLEQILDIIGSELVAQGIVAQGSTPTVGS